VNRLSERRLFALLSIRDENYQRWINAIAHSRSKTHLLPPVHPFSDTISWSGKGTKWKNSQILENTLPLYTISAPFLLYNIISKLTDEGAFYHCFSGPHRTFTQLPFGRVAAAFSTLVTLVGYFPNITTILLASFVWNLMRDRSRHCIGLFGGRYTFVTLTPVPGGTLDGLSMEYKILEVELYSTVILGSALQPSTNTIKYLTLEGKLGCEQS
jgi:hypothetical protein